MPDRRVYCVLMESFEDSFEEAIAKISEEFDQIGLYTLQTNIGIIDEDDSDDEELLNDSIKDLDSIDDDQSFNKIKNGETDVLLFAVFRIGEIAWSEKTLDPDLYNEKQSFKKIAPMEKEIETSDIIDDLLNWDNDKD